MPPQFAFWPPGAARGGYLAKQAWRLVWVGGFKTNNNLLPYHRLPFKLGARKTQTGRKGETLAAAIFHRKRRSKDRRGSGLLYTPPRAHAFCAHWDTPKKVHIAIATGYAEKRGTTGSYPPLHGPLPIRISSHRGATYTLACHTAPLKAA